MFWHGSKGLAEKIETSEAVREHRDMPTHGKPRKKSPEGPVREPERTENQTTRGGTLSAILGTIK